MLIPRPPFDRVPDPKIDILGVGFGIAAPRVGRFGGLEPHADSLRAGARDRRNIIGHSIEKRARPKLLGAGLLLGFQGEDHGFPGPHRELPIVVRIVEVLLEPAGAVDVARAKGGHRRAVDPPVELHRQHKAEFREELGVHGKMDPDVEGIPQGDENVGGKLELVGFLRVGWIGIYRRSVGKNVDDLRHARIAEATRLVAEIHESIRKVPVNQLGFRFHLGLATDESDILVEVVVGIQVVPAGTHGDAGRSVEIDLGVGLAALSRPLPELGDLIGGLLEQ